MVVPRLMLLTSPVVATLVPVPVPVPPSNGTLGSIVCYGSGCECECVCEGVVNERKRRWKRVSVGKKDEEASFFRVFRRLKKGEDR